MKTIPEVGTRVWCVDQFLRVRSGIVSGQEATALAPCRVFVRLPDGFPLPRPLSRVFTTAGEARLCKAECDVREDRRDVARWKKKAAVVARVAETCGKRLAKAESRLAALRAKAGK